MEKAEMRCVELELEMEKKKSEYEVLEAKFRALGVEKVAIEGELKALKRRNDELNERITRVEDEKKVGCGREREIGGVVDLTGENEDEDKVVQLTIENNVLEFEKKRAESEVEVWKEKCKELESRVLQLEVMRGGEGSLYGNVKVGSGVTPVGTSLGDLQTEDKVVELLGEGVTCISSGKGVPELQTAGTPYNDTRCKHTASGNGEKRGRRIKKHLAFEEDESPIKKMAPSTPAGARPTSFGVIDICDSDDEPDTAHIPMPSLENEGNGNACVSVDHVLGGTVGSEKELTSGNILKRTPCNQSFDKNLDTCNDNVPFISTPKRKKAANIVTSDTESDDDDNIPICKLKKMRLQELIPNQASSDSKSCSVTSTLPVGDNLTSAVTPRRRRLATLRQCEGKRGSPRNSSSKTSETKDCRGIPTTENVEDDELEEVESESEGESLGGFIVNSSDASSVSQDVSDDNMDGDDASGESQDVPDDNMDFDEILSKLQRNKDHKLKWEFEADMLAAFGKDPELCMKAVCALYRQQTSEEKISKGTLCYNGRGFSKFDALRGTTLAEFLNDGDPTGDTKKSVKELQEYDHKAVEMCRTLATRYSKQLFEIYKNKEDPFFLPS